jgi:hypothetical protein
MNILVLRPEREISLELPNDSPDQGLPTIEREELSPFSLESVAQDLDRLWTASWISPRVCRGGGGAANAMRNNMLCLTPFVFYS